MSGGETFANRGLIPRTIKAAFDEANKGIKNSIDSKIFISFTEIYGESVYDLLDSEKRFYPLEEWTKAQILETEEGLVIKNINVFEVSNAEEALNLFFMGTTNR